MRAAAVTRVPAEAYELAGCHGLSRAHLDRTRLQVEVTTEISVSFFTNRRMVGKSDKVGARAEFRSLCPLSEAVDGVDADASSGSHNLGAQRKIEIITESQGALVSPRMVPESTFSPVAGPVV